MNKWYHIDQNNFRMVEMLNSISTNAINIRLTIFFNPNISHIINYTSSSTAIELYIIPELKKSKLYSIFIQKFSSDWTKHDLIDICKFILEFTYD